MRNVRVAAIGLVSAAVLYGGCGDTGEGGDTRVLSSGTDGPDPFDDAVLATYEITVDPADWGAIVADPLDNTWRRSRVAWRGEVYEDVAVRPSGERSRIPGNPKPSLRLEFDEWVPDREFHKISSLKLDAMIHDPSMMRARLQYPAYAARGIPSPRYVHCRLRVNGDYKGLYGVEERVNKEFVRKRFGRPVNQLYKWTGHADDLAWTGSDPAIYVPWMWAPRVEELPSGAEEVRDLVSLLNHDVGLAPAVWDVESFLNFIAVEMLTGEGDSYNARVDGRTAVNLYLYKPPASGKYLFLPWDKDQGFWRQETSIVQSFENRILTRNFILGDAGNYERYKQILRELIAGPWSADAVRARVDFIFNQIKEAAFEDALKRYSNDAFVGWVETQKTYVEERNRAFFGQVGP